MPRWTLVAAAAVLAVAAIAAKQTPKPDPASVAVVQHVLDCRAITDSAQRLACYDAATAAMAQAQSSGDVVVIDREQARTVRRQAFGFNLPSMDFFKGNKEPSLDRIDAVVKEASQRPRGRWRFVLEDGAVWDQIDDNPLVRPAHAGSKAEIRKAALGSFFIKIDGQPALRVTRVQ